MSTPNRFIGPAAKYFEDFNLGDCVVTQGRTVTQADGLFWSMFSGDMNPMHVDYDYANRHGIYGTAFPAGLVVVAIASGLLERTGFSAGTGLAITEQTVRYKTPVLFGETIRLELQISELRPSRHHPRGTVCFDYQIIKTDGVVCVEGEWKWIFASRASVK
jgi:acyl dehydratase